jgi:HupE / UreJ protein
MKHAIYIKIFFLFLPIFAAAHPMPSSILMLDITEKNINTELQMPLSELQLAMKIDLGQNPENQLITYREAIKNYLFNHVKIKDWTVTIGELQLSDGSQELSGDYKELSVKITLTPNDLKELRNFELQYDVITHQVVTHETLVSVRNDWKSGIYGENAAQIGVIAVDIPTNTIKPFVVNQGEASNWKGFLAMFQLGMSHIKEGTDHLLFLLVLLLPAPLLVDKKRWSKYGGLKYSFWKLLKIITAFTVGHSVTLLLGTLGWIPFSSRWIEIAIAFSIFISAIHAIFPIFYKKEIYIAAGFGLIHGLAFSDTLSNMPLSASQMALSILGFNLGIEVMQLFVMALFLPFLLIICSQSLSFYKIFRLIFAIFASIAAVAWMLERFTETANPISILLETAAQYAYLLFIGVAILALLTWLKNRKNILNM